MVKVHPLAGKCGEGPPLAPELWKWRAGNRQSDMYFTSPTGEKFRSRPELSIYLATLDDPPPADSFQWRITEEFLANNQVAFWDAKTPKRESGEGIAKKEKDEGSSKKETGKRKEGTRVTPEKGRKKVKLEFPSPLQEPSLPKQGPLPIPEPGSERRETAKLAGLFSTSTAKPRPKMKATKKDKFEKNWEDDQFFTRVLASKVSWKWLYDNEAAIKFLAEAEKLKDKSDAEIADLRNILLHRSSDMNSISRYSNQVLRIFVQILRNVQPPSTMGKVELADLVVNWKCKNRYYWCLLETSRLAPSSQPCTSKVNGLCPSSRDDKATIQEAMNVIKKDTGSASQDRTNVSGGITVLGEPRARLEESDTTSNEELQLEVTLRDIQDTVRNIEETQVTSYQQDSSIDLNMTVPTTLDDNSLRTLNLKEEPGHLSDLEDAPAGSADKRNKSSSDGQPSLMNLGSQGERLEQGALASESVYNVQYKLSESVVILDRISRNSRRDQTTYQQEDQVVKLPRYSEMLGSSSLNVSKVIEDTPQTPRTPQISSVPLSYHFPRESSICWCKTCSTDQAFCRGCMCCLCSNPVPPADDWMAVRCNCKHLCHVKCALENNLAGAVKDLNLDGELSCPSCSRKVDLWPFYEKSFNRLYGAESKSNLTDLETHTLLVLRLLDGTQNRKYTYFRKLVGELHDLTKKFSIQNLVQQLIFEIKKELHEPLHPDSDATKAVEDTMEVAVRKRTEIEPLLSKLERAYQSVIDESKQVRVTQASNMAKRNKGQHTETESNAFSPLLAQQIESQKTKADEEFQKLVGFKSTEVTLNNPTLADIDSSMNTWLDAIRAQRRAVEAAETKLHLLKSSQKDSFGT